MVRAFRRLRLGISIGLMLVVANSSLAQGVSSVSSNSKKRWAIAIHGGAGADPSKWTAEQIEIRMEGLRAALKTGTDRLAKGDQAMDVVEAVVRVLEDNPLFNAGKGAVLNENGEPVLDASIMDGRDLASGAVAGVKTVKNPITAARRVISDTTHVLLMGEGADRFAEKVGLEIVSPEYFKTEDQRANWEKWKEREKELGKTTKVERLKIDDPLFYLGTVGCVVLDNEGNLAAGTSTGGLLGKKFGRVGDSPVIGAGTYAKNSTCAVSCTGTGEYYIRNVIAYSISAKMELAGRSLREATREAIEVVLPEDSGGLIAVDKDGNIELPFNTPGMARGAADSEGRFEVAIGKTK